MKRLAIMSVVPALGVSGALAPDVIAQRHTPEARKKIDA